MGCGIHSAKDAMDVAHDACQERGDFGGFLRAAALAGMACNLGADETIISAIWLRAALNSGHDPEGTSMRRFGHDAVACARILNVDRHEASAPLALRQVQALEIMVESLVMGSCRDEDANTINRRGELVEIYKLGLDSDDEFRRLAESLIEGKYYHLGTLLEDEIP